ncbi:MAG TPA: S41 family peptidase [Bacteroidia bacterium]|nr:S41 family peptidase [Bacteroidia bacterium]
MKNILRKFKVWFIIGAVAIVSAASFSFVDDYFEVSKNLDIFTTLYREVNLYYVDQTNPGKMIKKGIDAMLESLDPYTNFIPESDIEDYRFMTTGQYGGIGALIRLKGDYVVISEPYEGYPAHKAGLQAGDEILEIDGKSAKGKKTDEVSKALKGQPKSTVKVLVKRQGEKNPLEKSIVREEIKIKSVSYSGMLNDRTGYIRLTSFTESAGKEVRDAYTELKEKNVSLKGIILDLRENPGGLLNEAVNIANVFVPKNQDIVSTRGKNKDNDRTYKSVNNPVDTEMPVAVLINSRSASASEIVSGTIQDLDRGVLVGQRSFGKGLVQTTRPLSYNSQLKITTAKYYIPSGRCIQALDYTHRNEDGSVGKIPDSLVTAFKTKGGRTVYDGGGVTPDISLEPLMYSSIAGSLISKNLIFDYVTQYRLKHNEIPPVKNFNLTEEDFNDFAAFISDKEYDYITKSEKTLEELKTTTENEKYFDAVKTEYEALKTKMMHNKKEDIVKNKAELMELLKEEIVSRYYFQVGRSEAAAGYDPEIRKAVEVLDNSSLYASVLNGTYKEEPKKYKEEPKKKEIPKSK